MKIKIFSSVLVLLVIASFLFSYGLYVDTNQRIETMEMQQSDLIMGSAQSLIKEKDVRFIDSLNALEEAYRHMPVSIAVSLRFFTESDCKEKVKALISEANRHYNVMIFFYDAPNNMSLNGFLSRDITIKKGEVKGFLPAAGISMQTYTSGKRGVNQFIDDLKTR